MPILFDTSYCLRLTNYSVVNTNMRHSCEGCQGKTTLEYIGVCLFVLMLYVSVNNSSVMLGQFPVLSTKCLAPGYTGGESLTGNPCRAYAGS